MPRTARASAANIVYHVINRGNNRSRIFHKPADYQAFLELLDLACERIPMRILAACLMPNHFHLVLRPHKDRDLSRFMQWLLTSHVRRHHRHHGLTGHLYQGRFKGFPIQQDRHLLIALRYVERNPLRANLVQRATDWPWSTAAMRHSKSRPKWLADSPVPLPKNWNTLLNQPQTPAEEQALRQSLARSAPFGDPAWQQRTARDLHLESTLRPRGRPRIKPQPPQPRNTSRHPRARRQKK